MMKSFLRLAAGCLLGVAMQVSAVELKPGHPDVYPVKEGDTLWDISNAFLSDPWLWPELWHVNPQINNPHLIYPGDELALVYIDGKPYLTKSSSGVVKLSPQVRSEAIDTPIPAIPLEAIDSFLTKTRIVTEEELNGAPYVLEGSEGRIVTGAGDRRRSAAPTNRRRSQANTRHIYIYIFTTLPTRGWGWGFRWR